MSYKSLSILAILFCVVPTLEGMKYLKRLNCLKKIHTIQTRTIHHTHSLNGLYYPKDDELLPKPREKVEVMSFGSSVTCSLKDDCNTLYVMHPFNYEDKKKMSLLVTYLEKKEGFEYANIAFGDLAKGYSNTSLFQHSATFLKKYGQEDDAVGFHIIVPGTYQQRGAHYRLAPNPEFMFDCYHNLFKLLGDSYTIASVEAQEETGGVPAGSAESSKAIKKICQKVDPLSLSVLVYESITRDRKESWRSSRTGWILWHNANTLSYVSSYPDLGKYPLNELTRDSLRWLDQLACRG